MKYKLKLLVFIIFSFGCLIVVAQDKVESTTKGITSATSGTVIVNNSVKIEDPQLKQSIKTAYDMIVLGNKDMQIAILQAKVRYKIPEDWDIDLNTLTFKPQTKEELPKTTPQPVKP